MTGSHLIAVLRRFNRSKVDYVMIGVMAINHYADNPSTAYSTLDCDILVRPDSVNFKKALDILRKEGYRLEAGQESLSLPDDLLVQRLLEHRATVTAIKPETLAVDIVLEARGFSFAEWRRERRLFKVGSLTVPCGSLSQLLRSKELSGRHKDRAFLKLYRAALKDRT